MPYDGDCVVNDKIECKKLFVNVGYKIDLIPIIKDDQMIELSSNIEYSTFSGYKTFNVGDKVLKLPLVPSERIGVTHSVKNGDTLVLQSSVDMGKILLITPEILPQ